MIETYIMVAILGAATIFDLRKRHVPVLFWICASVIAVGWTVFNPELLTHGWTSLIMIPLSFGLWRGGIFGGSDMFALSILSVLAPMVTLTGSQIHPFTTILNAGMLSLLVVGYNVLFNTIRYFRTGMLFAGMNETKGNKIKAILVSHMGNGTRYGFNVEKQTENGKKFDFSMPNAEKSPFNSQKGSWMMPAIPFLFFIFGGFMLQLFYGDIILNLFVNFH